MKPPRATYRLQLGPELRLAGAAGLVEYLDALGVSHLYTSPIPQAAAGSVHGYDVVDPTRVSEALGGEGGFRTLSSALSGKGLGLVLDFVPNHLAMSAENRPWWDVLRNGESSAFAHFFDVDWHPPSRGFADASCSTCSRTTTAACSGGGSCAWGSGGASCSSRITIASFRCTLARCRHSSGLPRRSRAPKNSLLAGK